MELLKGWVRIKFGKLIVFGNVSLGYHLTHPKSGG